MTNLDRPTVRLKVGLPRRVKAFHDCRPQRSVPDPFPEQTSLLTFRWRCPVCRQLWFVKAHGGSSTATRRKPWRTFNPPEPPS